MDAARKIAAKLSPQLLEMAHRASGAGITRTVRTALDLVAASETCARLRQLRGQLRFTRSLVELKAGR